MKKLALAFVLMMTCLVSYAAIPTVNITAPVVLLQPGATTTVTFTFSEAPLNFDLTKINILGEGQFNGGLTTVNATTYTAVFQKTVNRNAVALVIDTKSYADAATSGTFLGVGNSLGFNPSPAIYIKSGNVFSGATIIANPQPTCPKAGQILADATGSTTSQQAAPVVEKYYKLERTDYPALAYTYKEINKGCLVRLVNGQKYIEKTTQTAWETANIHSNHSNTKLVPKINQYNPIEFTGWSRPRVKASNKSGCNPSGNTGVPATSFKYNCPGGGDFREQLTAVRVDADDPIVFPNAKGVGHLHTFFGNTNVNYQSNAASIAKGCNTTANGGSINCTGYWMPTFVDTATSTPIFPNGAQIYYKSILVFGDNPYSRYVEPLPKGLKLVIGTPSATNNLGVNDNIAYFCFPRGGGGALESVGIMPTCDGKTYSFMRVSVDFPPCLKDDGTGKIMLDSPNHRSHMIPPGYDPTNSIYGVVGVNGCPAQYPHLIVNIGEKADYPLTEGQTTKTWRLSSDNYASNTQAGASLHADYFAGWQDYWALHIVQNCARVHFGCGSDYVGLSDGRQISSIVTTVTAGVATATVTTTLPHFLNIGEPADYGVQVRISGVGGPSAAIYNFDPSKVVTDFSANDPTGLQSIPSQPIGDNIHGTNRGGPANTFTYVLPSIPTDLNPPVTNAVYQIPETLCSYNETDAACPAAYAEFWYGNKS